LPSVGSFARLCAHVTSTPAAGGVRAEFRQPPSMSISPWLTLALALPVLLLGEFLVKRLSILSRFNIPAPVASGLLISLLVLALNLMGGELKFVTKTAAAWWTWLISIEPDWMKKPALDVHRPFLVAFFTCIGLNASWTLVKRGSFGLLVFLMLSSVLAVAQNLLGVPLAKLLGESPLLGLVCGSLTLTGGVGTALGFAPELEKAGLANAAVVSVAAATFGLVAGGLIGGPLGGWLVRKHNLKSEAPAEIHLEAGQTGEAGIVQDFRSLAGYRGKFIGHLIVLLACVKLGAWLSFFITQTKIVFPVYMGALLLGVVVRNAADAFKPGVIKSEIVDTLASISLGVFLVMAMMSLNLMDLANTALPMLVILIAQVIFMALFAWLLTFRLMGRDYDAAVMCAGQIGFGLGATPNAVANMKALVERYGPSPRAFLLVPVVGGFLIDLINSLNITAFLNVFKS
jgi:ESS family glutamate:Na+ symporter